MTENRNPTHNRRLAKKRVRAELKLALRVKFSAGRHFCAS